MQEHINISDETLLEYIDGTLSKAKRDEVESQLHHPEIAGRLKMFHQIHHLMNHHFLTELPSDNFSDKVMQSVKTLNNQPEKKLLAPSLIVFAVSMVILLTGVLISPMGIQDVEMQFPSIQLDINFKNLFYGLLFLLLLASLWLLDKVWIQSYFKEEAQF